MALQVFIIPDFQSCRSHSWGRRGARSSPPPSAAARGPLKSPPKDCLSTPILTSPSCWSSAGLRGAAPSPNPWINTDLRKQCKMAVYWLYAANPHWSEPLPSFHAWDAPRGAPRRANYCVLCLARHVYYWQTTHAWEQAPPWPLDHLRIIFMWETQLRWYIDTEKKIIGITRTHKNAVTILNIRAGSDSHC